MHKAVKVGAGLTFAAVAITTTLNVASAKQTGLTSFGQKGFVVLARIIGGQTAYIILGGSAPGSLASQLPFVQGGGSLTQITPGTQPLGPINTTTIAGIITLIADWGVHQIIGGKYYYGSVVSPFIKAIGGGLMIGGIVGGLLDPPAGGSRSGFSGPSAGGYAHASSLATGAI
jgi:hypothetical protein